MFPDCSVDFTCTVEMFLFYSALKFLRIEVNCWAYTDVCWFEISVRLLLSGFCENQATGRTIKGVKYFRNITCSK